MRNLLILGLLFEVTLLAHEPPTSLPQTAPPTKADLPQLSINLELYADEPVGTCQGSLVHLAPNLKLCTFILAGHCLTNRESVKTASGTSTKISDIKFTKAVAKDFGASLGSPETSVHPDYYTSQGSRWCDVGLITFHEGCEKFKSSPVYPITPALPPYEGLLYFSSRRHAGTYLGDLKGDIISGETQLRMVFPKHPGFRVTDGDSGGGLFFRNKEKEMSLVGVESFTVPEEGGGKEGIAAYFTFGKQMEWAKAELKKRSGEGK